MAQRTSAAKAGSLQAREAGGLAALFVAEGAEEDTAEAQLRELMSTAKAEEASPLAKVASGNLPAVCLAILLILYADNARTQSSSESESVFGVIFEVMSAFGNVGLTLSTAALSTVASWTAFSKVVLICVMFLGRMKIVPERSESMGVAVYSEWGSPVAADDSHGGLPALSNSNLLASPKEHVFTIGAKVLAAAQQTKLALRDAFERRIPEAPGKAPPGSPPLMAPLEE